MRKAAVLALVLLASGCLCCGGLPIGKSSPEGVQCESPYIQVGGGCCIDTDGNGVCDRDEEQPTDSTQASRTESTVATTPTVQITATTAPQASDTTLAVSPTTLPALQNSAVFNCVQAAGFDPNKVIFAYSRDCGSKFVSDASMVSIRTGVDIVPMNIGGQLDEKTLKVLECFYGIYSSGNPEFGSCPRLLCPKTGQYKTLSGVSSASVASQMTGFAKDCR